MTFYWQIVIVVPSLTSTNDLKTAPGFLFWYAHVTKRRGHVRNPSDIDLVFQCVSILCLHSAHGDERIHAAEAHENAIELIFVYDGLHGPCTLIAGYFSGQVCYPFLCVECKIDGDFRLPSLRDDVQSCPKSCVHHIKCIFRYLSYGGYSLL